MEKNIFAYVLRYSRKDQLLLMLLIISFQPLYLLSLELPKLIINSLKQVDTPQALLPPFEVAFFGLDFLAFSVDSDILSFLLLLSFIYLLIVLITGLQKYVINVYIGLIGERLLRRLRYQLYQRVLRFPLKHFGKIGDGEIIPMIVQEVEPVGGFAGSAFADPLFQGGQLAIAIGYIMYQDWLLGMAALAFYPVQIIIIPKLQKTVNQLAKRRVQNVRTLSGNLGDSIRGVKQIHANNTSRLELSRFSHRISVIFGIRYKIYRWKFFIKFLNNFIDKLTPFFFFSIGGWLALEGRLDIGALFAALNAYKDVAAPWKEVLRWYQTKEDVRIKYEQVIEQFQPRDIAGEGKLLNPPEQDALECISFDDVSLLRNDGSSLLNHINMQVVAAENTAIIGDSSSHKSQLALLIAGLLPPSSGSVLAGDKNSSVQALSDYSESFLGRRIAYVDSEPFMLSGSIYDNMVYGICNYNLDEAGFADLVEAMRTGNSRDNFLGEWVDLKAAGFADSKAFEAHLAELAMAVDLRDFLLEVGLQEKLPPPEFSGSETASLDSLRSDILKARRALQSYLQAESQHDLVVPFEADSFNEHAGVLENIIFGSVLGGAGGSMGTDMGQSLISHPHVAATIDKAGLGDRFLQAGADVVRLMDEIFTDLPSGHKLYQRFAFVTAEDLPEFKRLIGRFDRVDDLSMLEAEEKQILFAIPFHLIPKRHRLGIVDDEFRAGILRARHIFREDLPSDLAAKICFYDSDAYNDAASIQENILFGKIATDRPEARAKMATVLDKFMRVGDLWKVVLSIGLKASVGLRGDRLNRAQKAKLMLVRGLLKHSDILILDDILGELDVDRRQVILDNIMALRQGKGVVLVTAEGKLARNFGNILVMQGDAIVAQGPIQELQDLASVKNLF